MTGSSTEATGALAAPVALAGLDRTFAAFTASRKDDAAWLQSLRREAFARFSARGLPTRRDEEWKYTSLRGLTEGAWKSGARPLLKFPSPSSGPGWRVTPLAAALRAGAPDLQSILAAVASSTEGPADGAIGALATAFAGDGFLVDIDAGTCLEAPLTFSAGPLEEGAAYFPRLVIRLGAGAEATVVENLDLSTAPRSWVNAVTEIHLAAGARLRHVQLQQGSPAGFHLTTTRATVQGGAQLASHVFTLAGAVTRNNLQVSLSAPSAGVTLDGLYVASGKGHVDNHTTVVHAVPETTSAQLYKGLLDGSGRAVFNGKVLVRPGAQKTDAYQMNRNLLLSSDAEIDTKPELQIDADDVKCSHGASIGPLNADQIFYLQSRALTRDEAVRTLSHGFADEMLLRLPLVAEREAFRRGMHGRVLA